ncbi:hypothetical protein PoB_006119200 [Plakobranchus ocellatus]|uniref:Uncharacterized protein n=1 Tax=Plakobranchus ocellatus TaxID=259542 RepID=A0AAV4CS26_9GAST|nr:hypothetical protein PoB_006119200 [Plakobranchus ocellatus]
MRSDDCRSTRSEYDKSRELTAVADSRKLLFAHYNWPQHGGDAFLRRKTASRRSFVFPVLFISVSWRGSTRRTLRCDQLTTA